MDRKKKRTEPRKIGGKTTEVQFAGLNYTYMNEHNK